jgi:hypothetical protein
MKNDIERTIANMVLMSEKLQKYCKEPKNQGPYAQTLEKMDRALWADIDSLHKLNSWNEVQS